MIDEFDDFEEIDEPKRRVNKVPRSSRLRIDASIRRVKEAEKYTEMVTVCEKIMNKYSKALKNLAER